MEVGQSCKLKKKLGLHMRSRFFSPPLYLCMRVLALVCIIHCSLSLKDQFEYVMCSFK